MAKKKNQTGKRRQVIQTKKKEDERVTMEALAEMSDSDDEEIPENQWSTKAKNLRQAIQDGNFDNLVKNIKMAEEGKTDDVEFEEDTLDSSDDNIDEADEIDEDDEKSEEEVEDEEESSESIEEDSENSEEENGDDENKEDEDDGEEEGDSENEDSDENEENQAGEKAKRLTQNNHNNSKALAVVTSDLVASHVQLPWAETFTVIPETPLPFGEKSSEDSTPVDIHDDLKREVAFYNLALEAVHDARRKCKDIGIPFSRPEDFFAEMVKTDDHMAKVKDRLIFETKKMEAVAQRKANREQKLRAKESQANKLAEKAKRKRDHFQQVEEWANSVARNRGSALQDDADEVFLRGSGPNKKRQAADRKYGFGGKRGRFKQNDRATLNDTSGFNPRGNFPGMGTKKTAKSRSGSGAARPGKRARDAQRSRR